MASIAQPHRRNPTRSRSAPKRYNDQEFTLKGSGKAGYTNGVDFDQYDRHFNGRRKPMFGSEIKNYNAENEEIATLNNLVNKLHAIDKINGHLPDLIKDKIKKAAIGQHRFLKDAEFIAPEGQIESAMIGDDDESEGEFAEDYETEEEDIEMDLGDD